MTRRLPPYGRQLIEALRSGDTSRYWGSAAAGDGVSVWLLAGADAWGVARRWDGRRLFVLAPHNEDPTAFCWSCLSGHDPILLKRAGEIDGEHLRRVLCAVMRDGTRRVLDLEADIRYIATPPNADAEAG